MSKNSTLTIACALCVGAERERYLQSAVAAIADAVDFLVVNDNSGLAHSENVTALESSAFATRGALRIGRHPFVDFADMRNRAFRMLAALETQPDWVLFLDADEIHGRQLRHIAREILPVLAPDVGNVDAYTYHFFGTFRWITDVARRFVFYRYRPDIRWENAVHERAIGIRGRALVLPYTYHHYGNVMTPADLARKHQRYFRLGNPVPRPPEPDTATEAVYLENAGAVRRYRAPHPSLARPTLAGLEREFAPAFATLDAGFQAAQTPAVVAANGARAVLETLRVELRRLEHPLVYRLPTRAR